ncbi:hypothetical protein [Arthrobacter sp. ISL-72]|uniref:hypothetical protein n=1 Tax=Arthrobacter sp. ISL-72 TaxID=2819114 RepID=UPI0037BE316E
MGIGITGKRSASSSPGASGSVLDAVARALQLDEPEHTHLIDLAGAAGPAPKWTSWTAADAGPAPAAASAALPARATTPLGDQQN